jgi:hypothetical protein
MNRFDISKFLFYAVSITGALGLSFGFGLYSGANKTVVYDIGKIVYDNVKTVVGEFSTAFGIRPKHFIHSARHEGEGVTVNDARDDEEQLILLSGFFAETNELRLIRRDGTIVARWPVRFSEIFPDTSHLLDPPATDWNVDTHGALALADGSVVFNFDYSGLVKLDRCGNVVWTLARQSHHSVERAEGGGFWVPGRRFFPKESDSPFPPIRAPFFEDTLMKVSEDGVVLTEISVPQLFYDNGLEALLTSTGSSKTAIHPELEIVHLNDIDELPRAIADDFPMFEAGDLALSLREYNLVMVVDPGTGKIKWWSIGPWVRQHDPDFQPTGKLTVFNNNSDGTATGAVLGGSTIVEIDPATDEHETIYGAGPGRKMFTNIRGKHQMRPGGGVLVTEFARGRVFETDAEGRVIWEYINRYSATEVAEISEARIYPASYFSASDWSCDRLGQ